MKQLLMNCSFTFLFLCLFLHGDLNTKACQQALSIWFESIVPSLFSSMVLIQLLFSYHFISWISKPFTSFITKFVNCNDTAVSYLLTSILLGFPSSAAFINESYGKKEINLSSAQRMIYTISFASPGFIILTCGSILFQSTQIGLQLFFIQVIANGILLFFTRKSPIYIHTNTISPPLPFLSLLQQSIFSSIRILFLIGGYLMLFMGLSSIVLSYLPSWIQVPFLLIQEFSSGIFYLHQHTSHIYILFCITSFLLGFGGLCVHMQVISMSTHLFLSYKKYFYYRILQAILSFGIAHIFYIFL